MNTNCLQDMVCPDCGQSDLFHIASTTVFTFTDDGATDHGDVEYDDTSSCSCGDCDWSGTVADTRPVRFTVLLLYPDHVADTFGQDTYLAVAADKTPADAIKQAQGQASSANEGSEPKDWFCLLCIAGDHEDVTQ